MIALCVRASFMVYLCFVQAPTQSTLQAWTGLSHSHNGSSCLRAAHKCHIPSSFVQWICGAAIFGSVRYCALVCRSFQVSVCILHVLTSYHLGHMLGTTLMWLPWRIIWYRSGFCAVEYSTGQPWPSSLIRLVVTLKQYMPLWSLWTHVLVCLLFK